MDDFPNTFVVFDCNVFAQALINTHGPAGRLVRAAMEGRFRLAMSEYGFAEVAELRDKLPVHLGVTERRINLLIQNIRSYAIIVDLVPEVFDLNRDPQ